MQKFNDLIKLAIDDVISDIFITGGMPTASRKLGKLRIHNNIFWANHEIDNLVVQLLNALQIAELREKQSLDFSLTVHKARMRINIFNANRGLSLAIRMLPDRIPSIDELNLHPSLNEIATLTSGLVLICGPTGMGKTTTVAAIIDEINRTRAAHIITLENPIEHLFHLNKAFIQQRELGTHMPSFTQGLLDALRENPDVIVVSELREPETMKLALNAAESGSLVIASLHASTPDEAIYHMCNAVSVEFQNEIRYQLASTLNWLIVQQLHYLEKLAYRVPVLTILRNSPSVKNVIRENRLHQLESLIQTGKNEGMLSSGRYLHEYLESRKKFNPPLEVFRFFGEQISDGTYKSKIMEKRLPSMAAKMNLPVTKTEPLDPDDSGSVERILTIKEGESLNDLLSNIK